MFTVDNIHSDTDITDIDCAAYDPHQPTDHVYGKIDADMTHTNHSSMQLIFTAVT